MKWLRGVAPSLVVLMLGAHLALPQEYVQGPEYRKVTDALMCQCGCGSTITTCSMEHCHSAEPIREEIAERIANGESAEAIIAVFQERYGLPILSAPPASGFHLTAWIVPPIALFFGALIVMYVLRSWQRQSTSEEVVASMSDAQRARIEKELRELSR